MLHNLTNKNFHLTILELCVQYTTKTQNVIGCMWQRSVINIHFAYVKLCNVTWWCWVIVAKLVTQREHMKCCSNVGLSKFLLHFPLCHCLSSPNFISLSIHHLSLSLHHLSLFIISFFSSSLSLHHHLSLSLSHTHTYTHTLD